MYIYTGKSTVWERKARQLRPTTVLRKALPLLLRVQAQPSKHMGSYTPRFGGAFQHTLAGHNCLTFCPHTACH